MLGAEQLRQRMDRAVVEEARHQAVDAAKKQAVAQRCDVETFEALVSTAHLRPMRGVAGLRIAAGPAGKPPVPRCFAPDGSVAAPAAAPALPVGAAAGGKPRGDEEAMRTGALFVRAWHAAPAPAERRRLLERARAAGALPRLLRLELSSRLLEELLACLVDNGAGAAAAPPGAARHAAGDQKAEQHQQQLPEAGGLAVSAALAAAVLEAAAGAAGFAVARAGLSLQGRRHLARLQAAVEQV